MDGALSEGHVILMESNTTENSQGGIVFVVDDDDDIINYITVLLASANYEVRGFNSVQKFLDEYNPRDAGCIISDIMMPEVNGLEFQDILIQRGIQLPIIFISAFGDIPMAKNAILKGALDFLEKPLNAIELTNSVQAALEYDAELRSKYRDIEITRARLACLTAREREVLDRLVAGESNKEIAKVLGLSLRTIENHRNNLLKKMHVTSYPALLRLLMAMP